MNAFLTQQEKLQHRAFLLARSSVWGGVKV